MPILTAIFHNEQDKSDPQQFGLYLVKLVLGGQLWNSIVVNGFLRDRSEQKKVVLESMAAPFRLFCCLGVRTLRY